MTYPSGLLPVIGFRWTREVDFQELGISHIFFLGSSGPKVLIGCERLKVVNAGVRPLVASKAALMQAWRVDRAKTGQKR